MTASRVFFPARVKVSAFTFIHASMNELNCASQTASRIANVPTVDDASTGDGGPVGGTEGVGDDGDDGGGAGANDVDAAGAGSPETTGGREQRVGIANGSERVESGDGGSGEDAAGTGGRWDG